MLTDIKKTALVAAATLALVRLHWVVDQIQILLVVQDFRSAAISFAGNCLFLLPFPILLLLLYRNDTPLSLSRSLRYLALTTAFVEAIFLALPRLGLLFTEFRLAPDLRSFRAQTLAAQLWGWLQTPWVESLTWDALTLISQMAFILFLVALFRHGQASPLADEPPQTAIRKAALIASLAGTLAVALNIAELIYAAAKLGTYAGQSTWAPEPSGPFIVRSALLPIPGLCWTVAAWIIYKGLTRASTNEYARTPEIGEQPL